MIVYFYVFVNLLINNIQIQVIDMLIIDILD